MTGERVLYGVAASPGIGIGHALVYKEKPMGSLEREIADPKLELERYHSAVETFCHVTQVKADRVAEMAGKERGGHHPLPGGHDSRPLLKRPGGGAHRLGPVRGSGPFRLLRFVHRFVHRRGG